MANETDFLELYRKLGLTPGCSLDELKQAYRRRVGQLHPDRSASTRVDQRAQARLQTLIAQYSSAMEFHRRYGRLPGEMPAARFASAEAADAPWSDIPIAQSSSAASTSVVPPRRSRSRWFLLVAMVAIAVLIWNIDQLSSSSTTPATDDSDTTSAALTLGLSADSVRSIEGEPSAVHDDRWQYGQSWVRFDHDSVIDWYSSPLHPLKTPDQRPPNPGT